MHYQRNAKIITTLGPSSSSFDVIDQLVQAGANVFRLNFSHDIHEEHKKRFEYIRELEKKHNCPLPIIADLQGPKLRIGLFQAGKIILNKGDKFCLDLSPELGNQERVQLPHPEIFKAIEKGTDLLLDDGRIRLRVIQTTIDYIETEVCVGGELSNRKGVNVPHILLPISSLTPKDLVDLNFALSLGVDFIALSFVQCAQDIMEAKNYVNGAAKILAKLEKPMAIQHLKEIISLSDGIMIARGDLGVEMLPEEVPSIQKKIIQSCRKVGKPVIVATQMLESMMSSPTPTRAEASDVATAIYDGVDAVMLSGESAKGNYPVESVSMMSRIITTTEKDSAYRKMIEATKPHTPNTVSDAIAAAVRQVAHTIQVKSVVTFTETGSTTLGIARERPESSSIALTPYPHIARYLSLVWGVKATCLEEKISNFPEIVKIACSHAKLKGFAQKGDKIIITAGVPFGETDSTNILRVAIIEEE